MKTHNEIIKIFQVLHFLFHLMLHSASIPPPVVYAYLVYHFLRFFIRNCELLGKVLLTVHALESQL